MHLNSVLLLQYEFHSKHVLSDAYCVVKRPVFLQHQWTTDAVGYRTCSDRSIHSWKKSPQTNNTWHSNYDLNDSNKERKGASQRVWCVNCPVAVWLEATKMPTLRTLKLLEGLSTLRQSFSRDKLITFQTSDSHLSWILLDLSKKIRYSWNSCSK